MSPPIKRKSNDRTPLVPAHEFRAFLAEVDTSQEEFGAAFGAAPQTVRRWVADGGFAPGWVRGVMQLVRQLQSIQDEVAGAATRVKLPFRPRYERRDRS